MERLLCTCRQAPAGWKKLKPGQFNEIRRALLTATKTG
jgi:hypothetical protein